MGKQETEILEKMAKKGKISDLGAKRSVLTNRGFFRKSGNRRFSENQLLPYAWVLSNRALVDTTGLKPVQGVSCM